MTTVPSGTRPCELRAGHNETASRVGVSPHGVAERLQLFHVRIASRTVESITVSHVGPYLAMRLPAWTDEGDTTTVDYVLQIDGVVRVSLGGTESVADPATGPDPVWLRFIGKTVDAASLVPPGGLRLMFRDGDVITVEGDARYEPWALHGSDATSIISAAGGRVEMLGPNSPAEGHII